MAPSKNKFWTWSIRGLGGIREILRGLVNDDHHITEYATTELQAEIDQLQAILDRMQTKQAKD